METIIVYVDDASYALPMLQAASRAGNAPQTHWVMVACAPRITHRVSKFVSNRARENWRTKWSERLFAACVPLLERSGAQVTPFLARGPLPEVLQSLHAQYGEHVQVVDLRRPKAEEAAPVAMAAPAPAASGRTLAGTLAGLGALWTVLVEDALAF